MMKSMRKVCEHDVELSEEERELLATGYKNVMGTKRASLRIISFIERNEDSKGNNQNVKLIKEKKEMVKNEFLNVCNDMLSLIDSHLIPSTTNVESTLYFYRMLVISHPIPSPSSSCCFFFLLLFRFFVYVGRETIFDIWQSLVLMLNVKKLRIIPLKHMRSSFNIVFPLF